MNQLRKKKKKKKKNTLSRYLRIVLFPFLRWGECFSTQFRAIHKSVVSDIKLIGTDTKLDLGRKMKTISRPWQQLKHSFLRLGKLCSLALIEVITWPSEDINQIQCLTDKPWISHCCTLDLRMSETKSQISTLIFKCQHSITLQLQSSKCVQVYTTIRS